MAWFSLLAAKKDAFVHQHTMKTVSRLFLSISRFRNLMICKHWNLLFPITLTLATTTTSHSWLKKISASRSWTKALTIWQLWRCSAFSPRSSQLLGIFFQKNHRWFHFFDQLAFFIICFSYGFYKRNSMNPASGKLRRKKNRNSHDVKSSLTATAIHAAMTSSTIADMSGEPRATTSPTSNSKDDEELLQVKSSTNDKSKLSTVASSWIKW